MIFETLPVEGLDNRILHQNKYRYPNRCFVGTQEIHLDTEFFIERIVCPVTTLSFNQNLTRPDITFLINALLFQF